MGVKIIFGALLLIIGLLSIIGRRHGCYFETLDEKDYPLKKLLHLGYTLIELLRYRYQSQYDKRLLGKFNELYGVGRGSLYLRAHWGNQITLALLLLLMIMGFALGMKTKINQETLGMFILIPGAAIYGLNKEVDQRLKKRQMAIKLDFTEFLNELILLLNAGMNLPKGLHKVVEENCQERPLYQELEEMMLAIQGGKGEGEAYEDFANRCRIPEIFKFVTLILQNRKKGGDELVGMLRVLSNECWLMRKSTAKILAEEASTKLLIPMMLMFLGIIMIVMTPALLAFSGI